MRQQFNTHEVENVAPRQSVTPSAEFVPTSSRKREELLRAYLAVMRSGLHGLAEPEKEAILNETRQHLLASAKAFEELGDAPDVALQNALAAFGSPQTVGSTFTETYQATGTARQAFPAAVLCASLRVFSAAMALAAGMMLFSVYLHQFAQEWAQSTAGRLYNYHVAWVITLLVPVLSGCFVGRSKLPRAGLGSFYALAVLAFGTAPLMLSSVTSSEYAQWQDLLMLIPCFFVFWMLTAPLVAHLSSLAAHRRALLPVRAR